MTTVTGELFAGLDDIAWGSLSHAYGSAEDVPYILRALISEDEDLRGEARWSLFGNIHHQGTRYEATPHAVPFLARLALADGTPERDHIVALLSAIAIGHDSAHLPQGYDPDVDRQTLAELRAETPEAWERKLDAWVTEEPDEWQRKFRERIRPLKSLDARLREAEAAVLAYEAVRNELPALTRLLEVEDPALRTATAYLLAWFPEAAETSVPALLTMVDAEPTNADTTNAAAATATATATATAIVALGLVGGPEVAPAIRPHLAESEPELRWAAAVALARLGEATTEVVMELAAAIGESEASSGECDSRKEADSRNESDSPGQADLSAGRDPSAGPDGPVPSATLDLSATPNPSNPPDPPATAPTMPFLMGDRRGLAAKSLACAAGSIPPAAFDAVLTGLPRSTQEGSFAVASAALQLAFSPGGAPAPPPAFHQLSDTQQRVVRTLAQMDRETWQWVDFTDIVGAWGFPKQRDKLRAYAGLPELSA